MTFRAEGSSERIISVACSQEAVAFSSACIPHIPVPWPPMACFVSFVFSFKGWKARGCAYVGLFVSMCAVCSNMGALSRQGFRVNCGVGIATRENTVIKKCVT